MSPAEIAWRVREQATSPRLGAAAGAARPGGRAAAADGGAAGRARRFTSPLPRGRRRRSCPSGARAAIIADADRLLKGEWEMLGVLRTDMEQPDWFHDPVTGPAVRARRVRVQP